MNIIRAQARSRQLWGSAAPSSLTALASGSGTIQLTWVDTSGESSYALQRSLDGNSWSQVASISANNTSYSDGSLAANTKYYYRLQAINSGGASPFGNVASATTNPLPAPPAAPTSLVAVAVSKFSVRLS